MWSKLCTHGCPLASGNPEGSTVCPACTSLEQALVKYFKFSHFRPGQLEALLPLVNGRDVFERMATGAGKSLCMFFGPLAIGDLAIGVVISPLNALMEQQVYEARANKLIHIYTKRYNNFQQST